LIMSAVVTSIKNWRIKPGTFKWSNSAHSPRILEATDFSVNLLSIPTMAVLMEFKLKQPVQSAYIHAAFTLTPGGLKGNLTHAFDYPYVLEKAAPYAPTAEGQVYHWGLLELTPLQYFPIPFTTTTVASFYNESNTLIGAIDYELTVEADKVE